MPECGTTCQNNVNGIAGGGGNSASYLSHRQRTVAPTIGRRTLVVSSCSRTQRDRTNKSSMEPWRRKSLDWSRWWWILRAICSCVECVGNGDANIFASYSSRRCIYLVPPSSSAFEFHITLLCFYPSLRWLMWDWFGSVSGPEKKKEKKKKWYEYWYTPGAI